MQIRFRLWDAIGVVTAAAIGTTAWPAFLGVLNGKAVVREITGQALEKVSVAGAIIGCVLYAVYIMRRPEK